jgi:diamine N-acetyltransferase
MVLRPARIEDILAIAALERLPGSRGFVGQWSTERHRLTLTSDDARYFVSEAESGGLSAFAILRGLAEDSGAIELKRIVVAAPGRGFGRQILTELVRMAFEDFHAHRLFLDVCEDNAVARHLYESLGFVYEGVMRDAARRHGTWCNMHLMSMLEGEYRAQKRFTPQA